MRDLRKADGHAGSQRSEHRGVPEISELVGAGHSLSPVMLDACVGESSHADRRRCPGQVYSLWAGLPQVRKASGTAPTEVKIICGTSPQQYELEAKNKAGKEVSVHVSADGKVVQKAYEEHGEH